MNSLRPLAPERLCGDKNKQHIKGNFAYFYHSTLNCLSPENHYHTIVIGVGSMGSAACYYLARRGQKVLGLEQFESPHDRGSHGGQSRIIRKAYFEHPDYVPLLERAYENWRAFETDAGAQLFHKTGIVYFGKADNETIAGVRTSARLHNIIIQSRTHQQTQHDYPAFNVPVDFDVIFEPDAGFVTPEKTIRVYVRQARRHGALIHMNTPVVGWKKEGKYIRVITNDTEFTSDKIIISSGAWTSRVLPQLQIKLNVTRQLLAWVSPPDPTLFQEGNFPCWFIEDPELGTFYGFPILRDSLQPIGIKLAHHFPGTPSSPDRIDEELPSAEVEKLRRFLKQYIPRAGEDIRYTKNCLYTYSPDQHFIIDKLPRYEDSVIIACGFSGHGFKFVPVIGEVLADLAIKGTTEQPIAFLGLRRFS